MTLLAYCTAVFIALLTASGQIMLKCAAVRPGASFTERLRDRKTISGLLLFSLTPPLSIFVMTQLYFSVFYSFTALNYIFITLLAKLVIGERIDRFKIIGNAVIVLGILVFNFPG